MSVQPEHVDYIDLFSGPVEEITRRAQDDIGRFFASRDSVEPSTPGAVSSAHEDGSVSFTYSAAPISEPIIQTPAVETPVNAVPVADLYLRRLLTDKDLAAHDKLANRTNHQVSGGERAPKRRGTRLAGWALACATAAGGAGLVMVNESSPATAHVYATDALPSTFSGQSVQPTPGVTSEPTLSPTPQATKPPHVPVPAVMDPNAVLMLRSANKYMYSIAPAANKPESKAIGAWIMAFLNDKTITQLPAKPLLTNDAFEVEARSFFTRKKFIDQFKTNFSAAEKNTIMSAVVRLYDVSFTGVPRQNFISNMNSVLHPVVTSSNYVAAVPIGTTTTIQNVAPIRTTTARSLPVAKPAPSPTPTPKPTPIRSNPVPDPRPTATKLPTSR